MSDTEKAIWWLTYTCVANSAAILLVLGLLFWRTS